MPNVAPARIVLLGTDNADGTITGVTTGSSQPINRADFGVLSFFLRSIGTTTGGTIIIEEADTAPNELAYNGTWSQIASILASSFTGSAQIAYHVSDSAYGLVRVRISSDITGGGTVYIVLRSKGTS